MPIISKFPSGSITDDGSGNVALGAVSNISTLAAANRVYIRWSDPEDVVESGVTVAEWAGTVLIRKAGASPLSRKDGTVVLESKTKNAYATSYFCDSGLTNGVEYYYKLFPYTTAGRYTDADEDEFSKRPYAPSPAAVTNLAATASGNGKVALTWTDPDDTVVNGVTLCAWSGTRIVYKKDSEPTSLDDGTIAVNSTVKNQYETNGLTVSGLTNGETYYFKAFPYSTDNVTTNTSNVVSCAPNRFVIEKVPSQKGTLVYGDAPTLPEWNDYDSTKLTLSVLSQINVGTYTATFTPKDDYMWSDGSTTAKTVEWTIGKDSSYVKFTNGETEITLDDTTGNSYTLACSYPDNSTPLNASSSDTDVVSVAINGKNIVITNASYFSGTATVTVWTEETENYFASEKKSIVVTCSFKPTVSTSPKSGVTYVDGLSGLSAADISTYAGLISDNSEITNETFVVYVDDGGTHRKISVGDQIAVDLTYESTTASYNFDLIGFNHDDLSDANAYGSATATSKAGMTFQMHDCYTTAFAMDSGMHLWQACEMRNTTLAAFTVQDDFAAVLKTVNKLSRAKTSGTTTTTTADKLFLLSEAEIFDTFDTIAYSSVREGALYAYYKAGNSKIKTRGGSANIWWTRSFYRMSSPIRGYWANVEASGAKDTALAPKTYGVAFAFCV